MKRLAVLLPPELQDDGKLYMESGDACLRMLAYLQDEYEVTLIVRKIRDKKYEILPDNVRVLYDNVAPSYAPDFSAASSVMVQLHAWEAAAPLEEEYDCAIALRGLNPWCLGSVLYRMKAKRKLVYLQRNPELYLLPTDISYFANLFSRFDGVICASTRIRESYQRMFGVNDVITVHPAPAIQKYRELAREEKESLLEEGMLSLITVEQMMQGNHVERIPRLAQELKAKYPQLRWYIFGKRERQPHLLREIVVQDVFEQVVPVGMVENPFPYILHCNGYVNFADENQDAAVGAQVLGIPCLQMDEGDGAEVLSSWLDSLKEHDLKVISNPCWQDEIMWKRIIKGDCENED